MSCLLLTPALLNLRRNEKLIPIARFRALPLDTAVNEVHRSTPTATNRLDSSIGQEFRQGYSQRYCNYRETWTHVNQPPAFHWEVRVWFQIELDSIRRVLRIRTSSVWIESGLIRITRTSPLKYSPSDRHFTSSTLNTLPITNPNVWNLLHTPGGDFGGGGASLSSPYRLASGISHLVGGAPKK